MGDHDFDYDLEDLRWHWEDAYAIQHPAPDIWIAQRRDNRGTIRADSPALLHDMIAADYTASPVPRDVAPRETQADATRPHLALLTDS